MKEYKFDPSLNILYKKHQNLDYIFLPRTIAVIGASEKPNSVGRTLFENLINSSFEGEIFAVNPKRESVLGYKAYKDVSQIPKQLDLVVIATPSHTVPDLIDQCAKLNVYGAIIISAGFKELGKSGQALEEEISLKKQKMRIIGPNCLGIMNPSISLNATFASDMALEGNIAFISQSGALGTAVLDWSLKERIGFSAFVSIGSMIDVDWGDLINYFGSDPKTKSILIYMESVAHPRCFLSAAREVALTKPIILIKAGKTHESAKAAQSHTGALAGSDDVLNVALKRVGVLRVDSIEDLFSMADLFSKQPIPKGPNLAIITNAGGPAVIASDSLIINFGKLAQLEQKTYDALNKELPAAWSHNNPIDILGDASANLYYKALSSVSKDSNVNGILTILTPQFMTDPTGVANKTKEFADIGKPILASWMGADSVEEGSRILSNANIPTFKFPDLACRAFAYMWAYSYNLSGIYETPRMFDEIETEKDIKQKHKTITSIFNKVREENRTLLDEFESKLVLQAFDIPVVITRVTKSKEEAVEIAKEIGFPIVLKLYSKKITHKSDVGGVKLNLMNENEVKIAFEEIQSSLKSLGKEKDFEGVSVQQMIQVEEGYELILGSSVDEEFGPVILFGQGGQLVEVYKDNSLALPPLTLALAKRLIERTRIYEALKGFRGQKPINLNQLEQILINFSNLIARYPQIKEIDINPLLASSDKIIALDARVILHEKMDHYPQLAIRPYPSQYVNDCKIKEDIAVIIRPIMPEDEQLVKEFYKDVSDKSLKQRYLKTLHFDEVTAHEMLIRMCYTDYDRDITLVVQTKGKKREIIAVGRLTKIINTNDAAFALLVKDKWHKKGIGKLLIKHLIHIAKQEKIEKLYSQMFEDNIGMINICNNLGFKLEKMKDEPILIGILQIH